MSTGCTSVIGEPFEVEASDGQVLRGVFWRGLDASRKTVIMLPGLAVPQVVLAGFARDLAARGFGVVTFDYRGVAKSVVQGDDEHVTLDDWYERDFPAVVTWTSEHVRPEVTLVFAHSIGGQLFGLSPAAGSIDGAVFLGAQRGIPALYSGSGWLRIQFAYTIFPLLIRTLGKLPVGPLTTPVACPSRAVLQWIRWGRTGIFSDAAGTALEHRFAAHAIPMVCASISDDDYAPSASVERLTAMYKNARVRKQVLTPAAYGLDRIGHFGFFRRSARPLWAAAAVWLERVVDDVRSARSSAMSGGQTLVADRVDKSFQSLSVAETSRRESA